jgi:hypothetical protein
MYELICLCKNIRGEKKYQVDLYNTKTGRTKCIKFASIEDLYSIITKYDL